MQLPKRNWVFVAIGLVILLGAFKITRPIRPVLRGQTERLAPFHSKVFGNDRLIEIHLPEGYGRSGGRRYPVLYVQDGQQAFTTSPHYDPDDNLRADVIADDLVHLGRIPPVILVAISSTQDRSDEYLPTKTGDGGGHASDYTRMLTDEVIPVINRRYRTLTGPGNTAVCGSSYGGVVALYMGLTRPDIFGKVGALSPSIWWDSEVMVKLFRASPPPTSLRIWMDVGTEEPEMAEAIRHLRATLLDRGWRNGENLAYLEDPGGDHSFQAWSRRFPQVLVYLFGPKSTVASAGPSAGQ